MIIDEGDAKYGRNESENYDNTPSRSASRCPLWQAAQLACVRYITQLR